MTNAVIEAHGLTKPYGTRAPVDHIGLAIEEGEVYMLRSRRTNAIEPCRIGFRRALRERKTWS